jgi:hypothetical protein
VEIATVMLRERVSVVVVRAPGRATLGVVTLARVLAAVLQAAGEAGPAERATLARDLADLHAEAVRREDPAE